MRWRGDIDTGTDGTGSYRATDEWPAHPRRLLTGAVIFDTMVPTSLAQANKTQMLRAAFGARAHIPDRVRGEIMGHAEGDARIRALFDPNWFAELHRLDRTGAQRAYDRQVGWRGPGAITADPSKDRGEAECHELAFQHPGWVVVSHDSNALHHGKVTNVPVFGLPDVLIVIAANGECMPESAWKIYEMMVAANPRCACRFWAADDDAHRDFVELCEELQAIVKAA